MDSFIQPFKILHFVKHNAEEYGVERFAGIMQNRMDRLCYEHRPLGLGTQVVFFVSFSSLL
jgi:hypothetical protein